MYLTDTLSSRQNTAPLATLSSASVGGVSIVRVKLNERPTEAGNIGIRPPVEESMQTSVMTPTRNPGVTVRRVSKTPIQSTRYESEEINLEELPNLRSVSSVKSGGVSVVKLPRSKTHLSRLTHATSGNIEEHGQRGRAQTLGVNPIRVQRVKRSSISGTSAQEMQ